MKGIFLDENHILDYVDTSLTSVHQMQTRVRSRTDVCGRQVVGLEKTVAREKEKENIFSFSVFRTIPNEFGESIANSTQIFESCLSHVTSRIEHPHSILDKHDVHSEKYLCYDGLFPSVYVGVSSSDLITSSFNLRM